MEKKQTAVMIAIENLKKQIVEKPNRLAEGFNQGINFAIQTLEAQLQHEEEMIKEFAENFTIQMGGALNSHNDIDDYFKANFKR